MQDKVLNLIKQHTPNLKRVQMDLSLENEQLKLAQEIVKLFVIASASQINSMTLEERKDNTYYDQTGKQILVGDLLKVFHFRSRNRNYFMYHVVVMEETKDFPVMAVKGHYADKPHCKMFVVAGNSQRVYRDAKIIGVKDWESKRLKINVVDAVS
jgi:hypothetical protein